MLFERLIDYFVADIPKEQRSAFVRTFFRGFFLFHILWACGWLSVWGLPGFAQAGEVAKVKEELTQKIAGIENHVQQVENAVNRSQKLQTRTAYESEIRRLDQEIFNAQARVKELMQAGLHPDRIYDERINELTTERDRVQSRLNAFMRANPDIAGETF